MVFVRGVGLRSKHRAETAAGVLMQIDHVSSLGSGSAPWATGGGEGGGAESAFVGVTAGLLAALIVSPSGARLDAVTLSSSAGTRFGLGLGGGGGSKVFGQSSRMLMRTPLPSTNSDTSNALASACSLNGVVSPP